KDGVVVVRESMCADKESIAYRAINRENATGAGELRSVMRERLPDYMVPSGFVLLDKLPLTQNGKVDRKALAVAERPPPINEETYRAPRTDLERAIAGVWEGVLTIDKVGAQDNFFDLGGHSLLMLRAHQ